MNYSIKKLYISVSLFLFLSGCNYYEVKSLRLSPYGTNTLDIILITKDTSRYFIAHFSDGSVYHFKNIDAHAGRRSITGVLLPLSDDHKSHVTENEHSRYFKRKRSRGFEEEVHLYLQDGKPEDLTHAAFPFESVSKIIDHQKNEIVYQSKDPGKATLTVLNEPTKYVIVHFEDEVLHLSNVRLDIINEKVMGSFNRVDAYHLSYLTHPSGARNHYNPGRSTPVNEVHLYLDVEYSLFIQENGIDFNMIRKIDEYVLDNSSSISDAAAILIPVIIILGVAILVVSTMSYSISL